MAEVKFIASGGGSPSTKEVDTAAFGTVVRLRVTRQAVISYEANKRQGTRSTRTRGMVKGARRKLWRQKGTGRARPGDRKTPQRRGGGIVFGPHPREFREAIPKKMRRAALRSALLSKFRDDQACLFEVPALEQPKTKVVASLIRDLGLEGKSVLFVTNENSTGFYRSARNIPRVEVKPQAELNALQILRNEFLVVEESALEILKKRLSDASAE